MSGQGRKAKSGQSEGGKKQNEKDRSEKKQDDYSLRSLNQSWIRYFITTTAKGRVTAN